jgi:hypothetical protein
VYLSIKIRLGAQRWGTKVRVRVRVRVRRVRRIMMVMIVIMVIMVMMVMMVTVRFGETQRCLEKAGKEIKFRENGAYITAQRVRAFH